jgi:hypothetical protein
MNRNHEQQIIQRLDKLDIAGGDVVVLTANDGMDPNKVTAVFKAVHEQYLARGLEPPIFTILQPGQKLETMSDDRMRDHGWVRALCPSCLTHKETDDVHAG